MVQAFSAVECLPHQTTVTSRRGVKGAAIQPERGRKTMKVVFSQLIFRSQLDRVHGCSVTCNLELFVSAIESSGHLESIANIEI